MKLEQFTATINQWASRRIPFIFLVDFEMQTPLAIPLEEIDSKKLLYDFNGKSNSSEGQGSPVRTQLRKSPIPLDVFQQKFDVVSRHLAHGDSFLTNLTVKTKIETDLSLENLFQTCKAKYRLLFYDRFLVFSPEQFVQIRNGKIYSYPMKGTIDAQIPNAETIILADQKELAEHVTIVDLIRNDLSMVADNVRVTKFRYLEEIRTSHKRLLQVSSEIVGDLPSDYMDRLGDIIVSLLPAGSISGAPKPKTVEIIREAEKEERGFYTGVAGIFDGQELDSGVLIRFIEKNNDGLFYRSGAGITTQSVMEKEYQEVIDKVYVPVN